MIFLRRIDLDNLEEWEYKVKDHGTLIKYINPIYEYLAKLIPNTVSPNVLSIMGLLFSFYAWINSFNEPTNYLNFITGISILIYMVLDAIDGKHARNTYTFSPLGELIDHYSDCISNVLLVDIILNVYHYQNFYTKWFLMVFSQIVFLSCHVRAFTEKNRTVIFDKYLNPTELLCLYILFIFFQSIISKFVIDIIIIVIVIFGFSQLINIITNVFINYLNKNDYSTLFGILFCFGIQFFKLLSGNVNNYIHDGMVISLITSDIVMGKICKRELHQLIPVMVLISLLVPILGTGLFLTYFICNVYDVSNHLQLPIFEPTINVFVSGYYDGFHVAHQLSLIKASRLGNRLTVGVHSQEDLINKTKLKDQEPNVKNGLLRFQAVNEFKYVNKTIPNCQLMITEEFIRKHKIQIVGMSDEYILSKDENGNITQVSEWYRVPFEMGILRIVPRTSGISSTELRSLNTNNKSNEELEYISTLITSLISKKKDN
jgi:glycerol-3-phosphate cytidylyltransferase-like family protein/phosphatidylglycerophosphate synthase